MRTRQAHHALTGQHFQYGDGPLANVAHELLANFDAREAARLADADERAAMAGKGPILDALRARLAEGRAQSLFNDSTPCVTRFDTTRALKAARSQYPNDKGLERCAIHAEHLWQKDAMGILTLGDVARLRAHYTTQYPRSVVGRVIDQEIPKVGFNTLPVARLAQIASTITGADEMDRQASYEHAIRTNGLTTQRAEHERARAFIRQLVALADEPVHVEASVADRVLARMATFDDPILAQLNLPAAPFTGDQAPLGGGGGSGGGGGRGDGTDLSQDDADAAGDMGGIEDEIPHDENSEVIEEVDSPITGDPMTLELGRAEPETEAIDEAAIGGPEAPADHDFDDMHRGEEGAIEPGVVASLHYFGQLDDFRPEDDSDSGASHDLMHSEDDGHGLGDHGGYGDGHGHGHGDGDGVDAFETGGEESSLMIEDPTSPGDMLNVTFSPVEDVDGGGGFGGGSGGGGASAPGLPNMEARRANRGHVFAVYAVRGGVQHAQPLERIVALGMPHALSRIRERLEDAEGNLRVPRAVHANATQFMREAFVILDDSAGNYLRIVAESAATVRTATPSAMPMPKVSPTGQPLVHQNVDISPSDGRDVLVEDKDLMEDVPAAASSSSKAAAAARGLRTRAEVLATCAARGLDATSIESRLLDGEIVRQGQHALELNAEGDVILHTGARGRVASLMDLDRVIADFQALAVANLPRVGYVVRAVFSVGCRCGSLGEYLMPDEPVDVRCAACGGITPKEAVAMQLERRPNAFPGYVITTDIPGDVRDARMNAQRMLQAIKQVARTAGAKVAQGQLEVAIRGAGDVELARIKRVLADVFGAHEVTAQAMPPPSNAAGTQGVTGVPLQPTGPMAPSQAPLEAQEPAGTPPPGTGAPGGGAGAGAPGAVPSPVPGAAPQYTPRPTVQTGTAGQNEFIRDHASKPPRMTAQRLVHVRYDSGQTVWLPVEAATDTMARSIIASFMDGAEILEIRAQAAPPGAASGPGAHSPGAGPGAGPGTGLELGEPPTTGAVPGTPGAAGALGLEPAGSPESIETAAVDPRTEETIKAAMIHYRNLGVGIAAAVDSFVSNYGKYLERYGDKTSPARHMVEAAVFRLAKEVYEQPALVAHKLPQPQSPSVIQADRSRKSTRATAAAMPTPKKVNPQQDDWVDLPGGGDVLGEDSAGAEGFKTPSVKKRQSPQSGTNKSPESLSVPDKDPKRFKAPKPRGDGRTQQTGHGQHYPSTDMGSDTQTGDNATTKKWHGVRG